MLFDLIAQSFHFWLDSLFIVNLYSHIWKIYIILLYFCLELYFLFLEIFKSILKSFFWGSL